MADEQNVKEIRNSILILKSNPMALQPAEFFLNSRGWEVSSATDLHEIIKLVLTRKPEYLLICANHPQKKVKLLPKILAQAVNIKIILYVDVASALNLNIMNNMGIPNYILPPVSGPAIERAVYKFEKDENNRQTEKKKQNKEPLRTHSISKGPGTDLESELSQFLDSSEEDEDAIDNEDGVERSAETFAEYEDRKRKERAAKMKEDPSFSLGRKNESKNENNNSVRSKYSANQKNKSNHSLDSIFVKGAQKALDSAVIQGQSKTIIEKLEKSQNCLCIVVDSTRFSGYLIAALGRNRRFDDEFVKNIQTKLFDFLKSQGEKIDDDGALEIKIKTVEFEDWALDQAEFLKKSVHNGDEVAMAFFPTKKTAPDVADSVREDMLQINIDDLDGDIQVPFDVYIYLPSNKKFVLYTPKGSTFMSNQKDRLKGKGITHMHMKKDEVAFVKKYAAENYLNNKVEEFNQSRTSKDDLEKKKN